MRGRSSSEERLQDISFFANNAKTPPHLVFGYAMYDVAVRDNHNAHS